MMKTISITLAALVTLTWSLQPANAAEFLIDFNNEDTSGYPGGVGVWNIFASPSDANGATLADTGGSTTEGLTIATTGIVQDSTRNGDDVFSNVTGGPSWVTTDGSLANRSAAGDYFWTQLSEGASFTITLGGITVGNAVAIDLFASRNSTAGIEGLYEYSLDGGVTWSGFNVLEKDGSSTTDEYWSGTDTMTTPYRLNDDGDDAARYMNATGLIPTTSTIQIRVSDAPEKGTYAVLNAMRVTTTIPEPASIIMVAMGALVLVGRRRQC